MLINSVPSTEEAQDSVIQSSTTKSSEERGSSEVKTLRIGNPLASGLLRDSRLSPGEWRGGELFLLGLEGGIQGLKVKP